MRWLERVWATPDLAEAIRHASPDLAASVDDIRVQAPSGIRVRRARKVTAAALRYVLRARHRATPFGLFAGIAPAAFADAASEAWGRGHRAVASPSGEWVTEVTDHLVDLPRVRQRLLLVTNHTAWRTPDHLVVPQYARPDPPNPQATTAQIEIRLTSAVRLALDAAHQPMPWATLAAKLTAEYPDELPQGVEDMLTQLIRARALLTSLSPASVETDPLTYLARALDGIVEDSPLVALIDDTCSAVEAHNRVGGGSVMRAEATKAAQRVSEAGPVGIDVRLDAAVALPVAVAHAAEEAAHMLTVLSTHPEGIPTWHGYRERFARRYGTELVPVSEVVHPDTGLGFPPGYTGSEDEPNPVLGLRDRWLMRQAQEAALTGRREIEVNELLTVVEAERSPTPPENTELNVRLESPSRVALDSGRFRIVVLGASRSAGTMAGRFAPLAGTRTDLAKVFTSSGQALPVQLSFPPVRAASTHVARAPQLLKHVLHVAEYPSTGADSLTVDDLLTGDDGVDLFLWSRSLGRVVVPVVPHALNLRYAPPLARFLTELPRAGKTVVSGFDWGAASFLPFLPRVRSGRVVLANARWRVIAADLPPATTEWPHWQNAWQAWAQRRNLPALVDLGRGDQRLRLDLTEPGHLFLLRTQLNKDGAAVLTEAPAPNSAGWCDGRAVEILLQLQQKGAS
ncbi:hypothetical protein BJF83_19985 [Nocardiopsis sp. CNR-923]|uniref:lantibiotic dehydratase family protein n=1 Tax=Nocardiopsis sp. CNR-923 TaxID=1904965 RepID=UPI000968A1B4|nr:lantibiotic dehydratase family protein [Nocardiopsis sp. CNR-923]OLT26887.1 hypothetical protein BJF83_19985 [Nocardiopsis sp. CNR-923]